MKSPKDVVRFIKGAPIDTKKPADARILGRVRAAYDDSASVPAMGHAGSRIARLAIAAVILIVAGALLGHLAPFTGGNVAWADVSRQFKAVPFVSVSIYMKEDATAEPTQMELLWMSQIGQLRLRTGSHVIFASSGQVKAYDTASRQPTEPEETACFFLERIGRTREFSLEAIIEAMFGGQATEVTPLVNPDAVISQDMVVFDVTLPDTPEWVRIWALRESRLPLRITIWDPRDGGSTDAIFAYSREQPAAFFDPNGFDTVLQSRSAGSRVDAARAFPKDPGGRSITADETPDR